MIPSFLSNAIVPFFYPVYHRITQRVFLHLSIISFVFVAKISFTEETGYDFDRNGIIILLNTKKARLYVPAAGPVSGSVIPFVLILLLSRTV